MFLYSNVLGKMPEGRDRLSRVEDAAAAYVLWRTAFNEGGNGGTGIRIRTDEPEEVRTMTPFRWGAMEMRGAGSELRAGGTSVASGGGTSRSRWERSRSRSRDRHSRYSLRSPGSMMGRENASPAVLSVRGREIGRGRERAGSILPSWYPRRTPLQEITSITRVMHFQFYFLWGI